MFKGQSNGEPQRFASYRAPAVGPFDIDEDGPSGTEYADHLSGDEHAGLSHEADAAMHALLSGAVDLLGEASALAGELGEEAPAFDHLKVLVHIHNASISIRQALLVVERPSSQRADPDDTPELT
jgi:hypothetical protein